ncbi:MAG: dual specificity protein phosphatase [Myxococcota bacterium]
MGLFEQLLQRVGLDFSYEFDLRSAPFNEVDDGLFVGERPTPASVERMRNAGVTHVVSCLEESEQDSTAFLEAHFEVLRLNVRDSIREDIASAFQTSHAFLKDAPVALVHCRAGVSRSVTVTIAQRMQTHGESFWVAFEHVRARRPEALPNIGFASQLQRFEFELDPRRRSMRPSSLANYLRTIACVPMPMEEIERMLRDHNFDAAAALLATFDDEIPRVVRGVRL